MKLKAIKCSFLHSPESPRHFLSFPPSYEERNEEPKAWNYERSDDNTHKKKLKEHPEDSKYNIVMGLKVATNYHTFYFVN